MPRGHRTGAVVLLLSVLLSCHGATPEKPGVQNGMLAACPDSPNCVSSQATDPKHAVAPFFYQTSSEQARRVLRALLQEQSHVKIVEDTETYLHAEFTIAIFGFVDDVEFLFDDTKKLIHVRSASRVGVWDLGVNRSRVERLRKLWQERSGS